jgi:hypothetical protein
MIDPEEDVPIIEEEENKFEMSPEEPRVPAKVVPVKRNSQIGLAQFLHPANSLWFESFVVLDMVSKDFLGETYVIRIKEEVVGSEEDIFGDAQILKRRSTDIDGTKNLRHLKVINKSFFRQESEVSNFRYMLDEVLTID